MYGNDVPKWQLCSDYRYLCRFARMEYHVLLSPKPTHAIFIASNLLRFCLLAALPIY